MIDPEGINEYLTNNVSRSIVYALLLSQPLTRNEIERSPMRESMRSVSSRQPRKKAGENERDHAQLRTLLAKGMNCGILSPYKSGGKNYYFLNSDLMISPEPILSGDLDDEADPAMEIEVEPGVGEILGDIVLPPKASAASEYAMPIPQIDSEKRFLLWLSWLSTPVRRAVLGTIAEKGHILRPSLRKRLGFWADRLALNEGIHSGILAMDGKSITFQFSSLTPSEDGKDKDTSPIRWIENPPRFMFARSYEPLRCIHGSAAAFEDLKKNKLSPMRALKELEDTGRKIIPKNRKKLSANFLELASLYGNFDTLPSAPRGQSSFPLLIPDKISPNDMSAPIVWIKETEQPINISKTDFAMEASRIIGARKAEAERIVELELLMKRLAEERIDEHLQKIEQEMSHLHRGNVSNTFSISKDSLSNIAAYEMQREELKSERKYAERFLEIIFGPDKK